jgi:hypothetical protein
VDSLLEFNGVTRRFDDFARRFFSVPPGYIVGWSAEWRRQSI